MVFIIEGLDCANCALKLEEKISKVNDVKSCQINFLAERMNLDSSQEALSKVKDICSNFEEGVSIKRIK